MNLVMFVGGTGTQASATPYPAVIKKSAWDAETLKPSDLMGVNGGRLHADSEKTLGTKGAGLIYMPGNFNKLMTKHEKNLYIYLGVCSTDGAPENNIANSAGYYLLDSVDGTDGIYLQTTNLAGYDVLVTGCEASLYVIGSAGISITDADSTIGNDLTHATNGLEHNVNVLFNTFPRNSEVEGTIVLQSSGNLICGITWTGTVYDDTVVDNNFKMFNGMEDKSKFPYFHSESMGAVGGSVFEIRGDSVIIEYIHILQNNGYRGTIISSKNNTIIRKSFIETLNDNKTGTSISCTGITFLDCIIVDASKNFVAPPVALAIGKNGCVFNCLIFTARSGIYMFPAYANNIVQDNIIINTNDDNTVGEGISSSTYSQWGVVIITGNIIINFPTSIKVGSNVNSASKRLVSNNIIWGKDASSSIGIAEGLTTSAHQIIDIHNNFIGNCLHEDTYGAFDCRTIPLAAWPFKESIITKKEDAEINDVVGGGKVIKKYDLGAIKYAQIASSGGGGILRHINGGRIR